MGLFTFGTLEKLRGVVDRNGDFRPAANADEQQEIRDRLGNASGVFSDKLTPSTSGDVLPSHAVDDGAEVALLADPANAGPIYIGPIGSATTPLPKGNGITFSVENTEVLEAKASSSGDVLHIIGEESA